VLIAQEAGCIVTDVLGRELDFSRGRGLEANVGILGAPPELHGRLVEAAKEVLDSVA
jgi:3'(2'), 5'-bisphosphate nucleotidase